MFRTVCQNCSNIVPHPALGELGSNLRLTEKKLTVSNDTTFEILLQGLAEAKEINPQFKPKTIKDLSDENEVFVSIRPTLLAWQDAFRTFAWETALPDPALAMKEIRGLLALVWRKDGFPCGRSSVTGQ